MTESNITEEHSGKHGVLTLGGSRNDVTIVEVTMGAFTARIDRSEGLNGFYLSDGWQFTPDPDPLPAEPGWYVHTSETSGESVPVLYSLTAEGSWRVHYGSGVAQEEVGPMAELHAVDPLVWVSFGVAS